MQRQERLIEITVDGIIEAEEVEDFLLIQEELEKIDKEKKKSREEQQRIKAEKERMAALEVRIAVAEREAAVLENALADPETWKDAGSAAEKTRKYNALKEEIEQLYEEYASIG